MVNDARKENFTQTKYYRKSASHATRNEIKRRLRRNLKPSECKFSILFVYITQGVDKENLFNHQELLSLVIINFHYSRDINV